MDHPVCSEAIDAVKEGVRFRCRVMRKMSCNQNPFKEFPDLKYMEEIYVVHVWVTPEHCSTTLAIKVVGFDCNKLYQDETTDFEKDAETKVASFIDSMCAELWQHTVVCMFRTRARQLS